MAGRTGQGGADAPVYFKALGNVFSPSDLFLSEQTAGGRAGFFACTLVISGRPREVVYISDGGREAAEARLGL